MRAGLITPVALSLLGGLSGCAEAGAGNGAAFQPDYGGVETRLLDGDLVNFHVSMRGARGREDVDRYAECAAAQYALIRGYGFARHLRTNLAEEGGVWRGDAIYTISAALPRGLKTIDAEVVAANCAENGIPMV
ncbi:hypothetical protein SAMN05444414_10193 [Roseovarius marisflavi]|uniref:Lipoprotein n=1 Tax=Roseovarius marisflavi TaxID=1054996 RepID=A0A1M6V461_9RHOB|nr:hypothetical protein [Roseovarius marisflavi]SHK76238.1 hypothetical protein SAMN05444414_10193 [Roseovarius marisflavi]